MTDDSDFYNDAYKKAYNLAYGSYLYDSQFQLSGDTEDCSVIFSGTPLVGYPDEDKIYSTIFKSSAGVEENIDSNIRILQTMLVTGAVSWNIMNTTTVLGSYTTYGYAGHIDNPNAPTNDIGFGVPFQLYFLLVAGSLNANQFNVYWSPYMAEITDKDSRLLTAKIRLNSQDIFNLDFSKFKYIDGSLWRLNKIEDYNVTSEDTCSVELLKVINTSY
jgi:hypothetical protein